MVQPSLISQLQLELPVNPVSLSLSLNDRVGLVIIDEVNGFCTVGSGNLAPRKLNQQVVDMVAETNVTARRFSERGWPILAFLDTHQADKPEPPFPPHCIVGTGEENLVPELAWLEHDRHTTLWRKDCIDAFIGAFTQGKNVVVEWVDKMQIKMILVLGICTDICVLDFVKTLLSARNHGMLPTLEHVAVYSNGCSTYDMPLQTAKEIGQVSHPQDLTHHLGLYFASMRGAIIANALDFQDEALAQNV